MSKDIPFYPLLENEEIIKHLLGADYIKSSLNDSLTSSEFLEANNTLAKYIYGDYIANLVINNEYEKINSLHREFVASFHNRHIDQYLNFDEIGMILVRPEVVGRADNFIEFLKSKNLAVLYRKKTQISFDQYWLMYHHGFMHEECKLDFPSRTFNYIHKDLELIVVTGDLNQMPVTSISDYIFGFKGKHGLYTKGTLRGDIAYHILNGYTKNGLFIKNSKLALDPIGAYRCITNDLVKNDRSHQAVDNQLLFYAGQAVHIPDKFEIVRDLSVLCEDNDIDNIIEAKKRVKIK